MHKTPLVNFNLCDSSCAGACSWHHGKLDCRQGSGKWHGHSMTHALEYQGLYLEPAPVTASQQFVPLCYQVNNQGK